MKGEPRVAEPQRRGGRRAPAPRLEGTGRLGDDLYLMAHNDLSGKPCVQPRALGLGLAGALLAELALSGSIRVGADRVVVTGRAAPRDELAGHVFGLLLGEPGPLAPPVWLSFLTRTAGSDVAARLAGCGYLAWVSGGRRWGGRRWVPTDSDCALGPLVRVRPALSPSRPVTAEAACLAGLADACGLWPRMFAYAPPDASRRCLEEAVALLDASLRHLIYETKAAVDSAVLSQRV